MVMEFSRGGLKGFTVQKFRCKGANREAEAKSYVHCRVASRDSLRCEVTAVHISAKHFRALELEAERARRGKKINTSHHRNSD